jgi:uncharacterized protein YebE (UPF0316 family)
MHLVLVTPLFQAFEDIYLYQKPALEATLYYINIVFVVLFTIEMIMKWLALGLKSYFSSFWTILDFLIVVVSFCFKYHMETEMKVFL